MTTKQLDQMLAEPTLTHAQRLMTYQVREGMKSAIEDTDPLVLDWVQGPNRDGGKGRVDFDHPSFSFRAMRESIRSVVAKRALWGTMREAVSSGMFGQLLRAGVMTLMNSWYAENLNKLAYMQICAVQSSDRRQEFYAPLHTAAVQTRTPDGTPYSESDVKGEDIPLVNETFTGGESYQRQLVDDDQTNQIKQRNQALAEAGLRTLEIYFTLRYLGAGGIFGPLSVGASNWPNLRTSVNQFGAQMSAIFSPEGATGLGNRVAAMGQLSIPLLKEATDLMERMPDLQGNLLGNVADTLMISTKDRTNARILAGSQFYPGVPGRGAETASTAASGFMSGGFAKNPFEGAFNVVVARYLTAWAWSICMAGRGIVFQHRTPLEVAMEVPLAGESFTRVVTRLRTFQRFQIDWTDPRFHVLGSDGVAGGTF